MWSVKGGRAFITVMMWHRLMLFKWYLFYCIAFGKLKTWQLSRRKENKLLKTTIRLDKRIKCLQDNAMNSWNVKRAQNYNWIQLSNMNPIFEVFVHNFLFRSVLSLLVKPLLKCFPFHSFLFIFRKIFVLILRISTARKEERKLITFISN